MTNFKKTVAAITLMVVMAFTTTVANAGLIISDATGNTPPACTQEPNKGGKDSGVLSGLTGIITAGFTGIITAGFTGIITAGFSSDEPVNCGIITAG